jgi:hypothetical protein
MSNTDHAADELRAVAFVLRRLGTFRHHLTGDECLRIGEALRDCADQIDHGAGPVTPPALQLEQLSDPKPATDTVQVTVRPLSAVRRAPGRPATARVI